MNYLSCREACRILQSWTDQSAPCSDIASLLVCAPLCIAALPLALCKIWKLSGQRLSFHFYVCAVLGLVLVWWSRSPLLLAVITPPPVTKLGLVIFSSSRQGFLIFQEIMRWLPPLCVPSCPPRDLCLGCQGTASSPALALL